MMKRDIDRARERADEIGLQPEELIVRIARRLGISKRIVVRSTSGGLRIVEPGDNLVLADNEFIANVPRRMIRAALADIDRKGGRIARDDQ